MIAFLFHIGMRLHLTYHRVHLWWWRRGLHQECVDWQLLLWHGHEAPLGACTKCLPKMHKIRESFLHRRALDQVAAVAKPALPPARVVRSG